MWSRLQRRATSTLRLRPPGHDIRLEGHTRHSLCAGGSWCLDVEPLVSSIPSYGADPRAPAIKGGHARAVLFIDHFVGSTMRQPALRSVLTRDRQERSVTAVNDRVIIVSQSRFIRAASGRLKEGSVAAPAVMRVVSQKQYPSE